MDKFCTRTTFSFLQQISDPAWLFVDKLRTWTITRLQHPQFCSVDLNLPNKSHSLERKYLMLCGIGDANLSYLKKKLKPASSFKHFRNTTRMSEA